MFRNLSLNSATPSAACLLSGSASTHPCQDRASSEPFFPEKSWTGHPEDWPEALLEVSEGSPHVRESSARATGSIQPRSLAKGRSRPSTACPPPPPALRTRCLSPSRRDPLGTLPESTVGKQVWTPTLTSITFLQEKSVCVFVFFHCRSSPL